MIESNAVQMCARKMPAVVGHVRAIDVFLEEFESVDADCRKQLRLEVSSGVYIHLSVITHKVRLYLFRTQPRGQAD